MRTLVYFISKNRRSHSVTQTLCQGLQNAGVPNEHITLRDEREFTQRGVEPVECVMFYGLSGNMMQILHSYKAAGITTCFWDLGYWGRKRETPPMVEFHRVAVNSYQPTAYFRRGMPPGRFYEFKKPILPWQSGGEEILVAGMSDKASQVWGLGTGNEHAQWLVDQVRAHTDRPIAYRPKPSWQDAQPVPGTRYAVGKLEDELRRAFCVVSYRSNLGVDALIAGVPIIVLGDHPSLVMSHNDLSKIEEPMFPDDRLEFCSDLAWVQFSLAEMGNGFAFRSLKTQGLIPL